MNSAFLRRVLTAGLLALFWPSRQPRGNLDKVSFGTNWVAEAEHGGFFQAVADGTYKKYGSTSLSCRAAPTTTTACC